MKIKTMIVDDHTLFNEGLTLILNESKLFEVVEQVFDSRTAYARFMVRCPELVLLDLNMPYLNGLELARQLIQVPDRPKIVVISMYAEKKEVNSFKMLEVDGYLAKTIPSRELLGSLVKIMAGEKIFNRDIEEKKAFDKDYFEMQHRLTKRELEVLKSLKRGMTSEQIAEHLSLSLYTVQTHRKNINRKLPIKSKVDFFEFLESINFGDEIN